jgi:tetratricopeptide (TPR) repeat protein
MPKDISALAQSPPHLLRTLYFELGRALTEHGRHAEAVAALEQALREAGDAPRNVDIGRLLATARAAVGNVDGALDASLKALLDAEPNDAQEVLRQAEALVADARLAAHHPLLSDARWSALLTKSELPARTRIAAGVLLGGALLQIDDPMAAEPLLAIAAELETENPMPLQLYGRALERLGRHEDAVAALQVAQRRAIDNAEDRTAIEIAIELARALLGADRVKLALAALPDPIPADDQLRGRTLQVRGSVLLASGAAEEALAVSREAAELIRHDPDALRVQAQALVALHRGEEALRIIDKGLNRNPTDEDLQLRRLLAQLESQEGLESADGWQLRFLHLHPNVISACVAEPAWRGRDDDGRAHYARAVLFWVLADFPQAVTESRRALELGLGEGLPPEPEAPVHALLAESLEKQGNLSAATEARFKAGLAYYYRGEWGEAAKHLESTVARQPEHPRASWILAEALDAQAANLLTASTAEAVTDDRQAFLNRLRPLLEQAEQVWDKAAHALPDQIEAWAYGSRAIISEDFISIYPERRTDLLWTGATFIERGLLKDDQNSFLWATIAHMYRLLKLDACARATIELALEIAPYDLNILEERIIFCHDTGDYQGALAALEEREARLAESTVGEAQRRLQTAWHLACRASVAAGLGEYEETLRLVESSLQINDGIRWIQQPAGRAHRMLGDREASRRLFAEMLARPDTGDPDWKEYVAMAQFALGRPDDALETYERWRLESGLTSDDIELQVGLCQLLRGDVEEGQRIIETRILRRVNREDIAQLRYGLRVAADEADDSEIREQLDRVSRHVITLAERTVQELVQRPDDPDADLISIVNTSQNRNDACAAAMAGLARRAGKRGDWETAAAWYERLDGMKDVFPELNRAFEKVTSELENRSHDQLGADDVAAAVHSLEAAIIMGRRAGRAPSALANMHQALGDALVRREDAKSAMAQYASALGFVDAKEVATVTALRARLAIASDLDAIPDPRRERLTNALRDYAGIRDAEYGRALGDLAQSLIGSTRAYARLDSAWAAASIDPALPPDLRLAVADARAVLVGVLDDTLGLSRIPEDLVSVVTPIVLELGDALIPIVDPRQDGDRFLYELIPAMRDRISAATGVTVPGVRARGNPALEPTGFSIQVDEVPVATAALNPNSKFAAVPGVQQDAWLTDFDPSTGDLGVWAFVPAAEVDKDNQGDDRLTAADVLAHHIESVVRANLRRYLGPEEVSQLVAGWADFDEQLVAAVLPDEGAKLRLTWVLQALANDAVPLTDPAALLSGIRDAGGIGTPTRTLYRALRYRLRDRLPGPNNGFIAVPLPTEYEASLFECGTVEARFEFRLWLREYVATSGPAITLITESSQVRELVSELARVVHPLIKTLTKKELDGPIVSDHSAPSRPGSL